MAIRFMKQAKRRAAAVEGATAVSRKAGR